MAVRISDSQNLARHGLALRREEFEAAFWMFDYRQKRDWTVLDAHLDRESPPNFAVIDAQGSNLRLALCNRYMPWTVVPHQNVVELQIERIKLGK